MLAASIAQPLTLLMHCVQTPLALVQTIINKENSCHSECCFIFVYSVAGISSSGFSLMSVEQVAYWQLYNRTLVCLTAMASQLLVSSPVAAPRPHEMRANKAAASSHRRETGFLESPLACLSIEGTWGSKRKPDERRNIVRRYRR